jgi:hypothetical protein
MFIILFFFTLLYFQLDSVTQIRNNAIELLNWYFAIQEKRIRVDLVILIKKNDPIFFYGAIGKTSSDFYRKAVIIKFNFQLYQETLTTILPIACVGKIITFNKK